MSETAPSPKPSDAAEPDSGYWRLEDQINWYDRKAGDAQSAYKRVRIFQIIVTALVPISAVAAPEKAIFPGILGAVVLILEGTLELGAFHRNWIKYRATCEALRHEKFLFVARAGHYEALDQDQAFKELVERVEALISTEHAQWIRQAESQRRKEKQPTQDPAAP